MRPCIFRCHAIALAGAAALLGCAQPDRARPASPEVEGPAELQPPSQSPVSTQSQPTLPPQGTQSSSAQPQDPSSQDFSEGTAPAGTVPPTGQSPAPNPSAEVGNEPPAGPMGEAAPAPDVDFTDDKIDRFAQAYIEATRVQDQYRQQLMSASGAQIQQIQRQAEAEIVSTIENQEGISVAEFEQIQISVGTDAQLRQRVAEAVERHAKGGVDGE